MCKKRTKVLLFDYLLQKLLEWERELNPEKKDDELLQNFSTVRLMKLLYFVCVQSVPESNSNNNTVDQNLFSIFDNYIALNRGPVEKDVYENRYFLPNFSFDGDRFKSKEQKEEMDGLESYKTQIDEAVKGLKKYCGFPFQDTRNLIDLSHDLQMWKDARMVNNDILPIHNIKNLIEEKKLLNDKYSTSRS